MGVTARRSDVLHGIDLRAVRVYAEVAARSFRRYSTYRGAVLAGVVVNTVFGFINVGVLRAALAERSEIGGLDRVSIVAFTFAVQALLMNVTAFGDFGFPARVLSGDVASEMSRPMDFSLYRLSYDVGRSLFFLPARGIPPLLAGYAVFRFDAPHPTQVLRFVIVAVAASFVASRIWTIIGVLAFWMTDATGPVQLGAVCFSVLGGLLVPIQFLPDAVAAVARVLPFVTLLQYPAEVFIGRRSLGSTLAVQVLWFVVLETLLRLELRAARRKLVINGG
jgi:ABC-2 type transport system permease protein